MLEIIHGQSKIPQLARELREAFANASFTGTLYIGYPVIATANESITIDALLVTEEHGLVALLFPSDPPTRSNDTNRWHELANRQDQLFVAVENNLRRHEALRDGRRLAVTVNAVTVVSNIQHVPDDIEGDFADFTTLVKVISSYAPIEPSRSEPLNAALQRVSTIRPTKRRASVASKTSKGALLQRIESEIANLDQWQKRAAIECPEGPQRIRGLAGSGKTVVLALKAAYLHAQHPDWTIAVTFSSRALYQQFEDLVRRFSFEHLNDEPDWQKILLLHSWGGRGRAGLYHQLAVSSGVTPRDFLYARSKYGQDDAFSGICSELLASITTNPPDPIFDAVLIDEAQDLPVSFFQIVYQMTKPPKRIVWAYDDLQNLSATNLPLLEDQFGRNSKGQPNVVLNNPTNGPRQDIILPICYRNTPWALTLAHGLGLGTARSEGLVQSFDEPSLWTSVGYSLDSGRLTPGAEVTLSRGPESYPPYFTDLITPAEAIHTTHFDDPLSQAQWLARSIHENLTTDELDHDDILIVLPWAYTAKSEALLIQNTLSTLGIESHVVGVDATQDEVFAPNSIALANIYRSKGNECPMVYVVNAQHCISDRRAAAMRNILFTAITRSKAWVRVSGWGPDMITLTEEISTIANNQYRLQFRIPTAEALTRMRRLHRDLSASEQDKLRRVEEQLRDAVEEMERQGFSVDDLPPQLRTAIARRLGVPTDVPE